MSDDDHTGHFNDTAPEDYTAPENVKAPVNLHTDTLEYRTAHENEAVLKSFKAPVNFTEHEYYTANSYLYSWSKYKFPREKCAESYVKRRENKEIQEEIEEQKCREERQRQELISAQYRPHYVNPAEILSRGMQILAEDTDDLGKGFPYPSVLAKFDISLSDWIRFQGAIIGKFEPCGGGRYHHPQMHDFRINNIAKNIEFVLDNVAELDIAFFRPRGLIMRIDMPGEQKFGLDFMDLYLGNRSYLDHPVHNLSFRESSEIPEELPARLCQRCENVYEEPWHRANKRHQRDIRLEFFEGTRIVIDPLTVLEKPKKAYKRGWTNWIQQCKDAKEKEPRDEDKPLPLLIDAKAEWEYFTALDKYFEPMRKRPISERVFRWPPSKQIYYDRWRGHTNSEAHYKWLQRWKKERYLPRWIPWEDSMDKRMADQWHPKCVVPADEIEVMVMEGKKHHKKFSPMITPRERRFPALMSEVEAAYFRVHYERCHSKPKKVHHTFKEHWKKFWSLGQNEKGTTNRDPNHALSHYRPPPAYITIP